MLLNITMEIQEQIKDLPVFIFNSWMDNKDVSVTGVYGRAHCLFL